MPRRASSLYRSVAPWHPASAWVLLAATAVFASTWVAHGFSSGVRGGLAVFVAWAIVRELAPKRALASLLAPVAAVAWAIPGSTDVLASVAVLFAARIAARSVGDPPTLLDCVLLVPFAGWVAMREPGLPAGLVLAAIVFADAAPAARLRLRVTGALMLAAVLVAGAVEGTLTVRPQWGDPALGVQLLLLVAAASAIALLVVPLPRLLRTRDDRRRDHLRGSRIRAARLASVASLLAAAGWLGVEGVLALAPVAAAVCAGALGGARLRAAR